VKVVVTHDHHGNIHSVMAVPDDAPAARPVPRPGLLVSEAEVDLAFDSHDEQGYERLLHLVSSHRVEGTGKAKLVPKDSEKQDY
jgi:hypothetical protein